jgi:hypothetical protein
MTLIFPHDPDPTLGARTALASIKEGGGRPPDVASRVSTHLGLDPAIIQSIVLKGDISGLTGPQKVDYYNYRCFQCGLDPAAKPFDILKLNGKEVLYANATASQQLTNNRHLSHQITSKERMDDIYVVSCKVFGADGRFTENIGAVPIAGLKGEALANTCMKGTTKAIRRTVLTHCGLGLMDETEVATIQGAVTTKWDPPTTDGHPDDKVQSEVVSDLLKDPIYEWTESDREALNTALDTLQEIAEECDLDDGTRDQAVAYYQKQASEGQEPSRILNRIQIYTEKIQAKARQRVD